jgi:hypothetical protein
MVLEIVGIILALVALVVGVPPFTQMLFGRPKIVVGFDAFTGDNTSKSFIVTAKNIGIKNPLIKALGVVRETGDIQGFFDVRELGTNRYAAKDLSGLFHSTQREQGFAVRVLPHFTAGMTVAIFTDCSNIVDARQDKLIPIPEGDYTVEAVIICGDKRLERAARLKIGPTKATTFWY